MNISAISNTPIGVQYCSKLRFIAGDVLGLLLDLEKGLVMFSLNGSEIEKDFKVALSGYVLTGKLVEQTQ